ncbi:MAG: hypothetical protein ACK2UP_02710, partial [Candidatus Promineifilaceae bacterium]
EVLDHLPNEERLLILVTSVVDRFCAPLIDKLSEGSIPGIRGSDLLEALWPSNFFMVALYEKLEVHGRRQAVAKATRLGILTDKQ